MLILFYLKSNTWSGRSKHFTDYIIKLWKTKQKTRKPGEMNAFHWSIIRCSITSPMYVCQRHSFSHGLCEEKVMDKVPVPKHYSPSMVIWLDYTIHIMVWPKENMKRSRKNSSNLFWSSKCYGDLTAVCHLSTKEQIKTYVHW